MKIQKIKEKKTFHTYKKTKIIFCLKSTEFAEKK